MWVSSTYNVGRSLLVLTTSHQDIVVFTGKPDWNQAQLKYIYVYSETRQHLHANRCLEEIIDLTHLEIKYGQFCATLTQIWHV